MSRVYRQIGIELSKRKVSIKYFLEFLAKLKITFLIFYYKLKKIMSKRGANYVRYATANVTIFI